MVSPPLSKPLNSCHDSPGQGRGDLEYSEGNWRPWGSNQALWGVKPLLRCLCSLVDHCRPIRDQIKLCWLFILLWVCSDVLVHISQKHYRNKQLSLPAPNQRRKQQKQPRRQLSSETPLTLPPDLLFLSKKEKIIRNIISWHHLVCCQLWAKSLYLLLRCLPVKMVKSLLASSSNPTWPGSGRSRARTLREAQPSIFPAKDTGVVQPNLRILI